MPASWNPDVTVNVLSNAQAVERASFGIAAICTAELEAGFTETYRLYESNSDAQEDKDLKDDAKAAVAAFYSQTLHPKSVAVVKVVYATLATSLDAYLAAVPAADEAYCYFCDDFTLAYQNALADWCLANSKLAAIQSEDAAILDDTAGNLFEILYDDDANGRAFGYYHDATEYAALAQAAVGLSADPDQTASVWYDKTLTGITPEVITTAQKAAVLSNKGNLVLRLMGVSATGHGTLFDGNYIDTLISKDWLKARIGEAVAQLKLDLSNRNQKIPYTNAGLAMIEAVIRGVCKRGERIGHFAEGSTVITVPDISDVDPADIIARACTIPVTVTLSGGILTCTINVGVLSA
jgi:hypothetical protein